MTLESYGFDDKYCEAVDQVTGTEHAFKGVFDGTTMKYFILCTGEMGTKNTGLSQHRYQFWTVSFGRGCSRCKKLLGIP